MGYYVQLEESTFKIPPENLEEATRRLKALNHKPGVYKRGGSSDGREWFSWMEENYDEIYNDASEILEALGFSVYVDVDGGIIPEGYDNKSGQEELFITEIGDLAEEGWHMVWRGEDGDVWKHDINGITKGKMVFE